MDLLELRNELDGIDKELIRLLEERLKVCQKVAAYKIETGKPVFDRERERQKIASVKELAHGAFNEQAAEEMFSQLMTISRRLQYQILEEHGKKADLGFAMVDSLKKEHVRVVYQGVEGAYSHEAARKVFGDEADWWRRRP